MDSFIQRQSVDLLRDNPILVRDQPIIKGDTNALRWIVTVTKGGVPVDFTGATASLYCARAMLDDESSGTTWSSAATTTDGTVTAVLPQDAANVAGPVGCTLRVTQNGASVTVARMAVMAIDPNGSDIVDVGKRMPNIDEVLAAVARCEEAASSAEIAANNANSAAAEIDSKIADKIAPTQKEVDQLKEDLKNSTMSPVTDYIIDIKDLRIGAVLGYNVISADIHKNNGLSLGVQGYTDSSKTDKKYDSGWIETETSVNNLDASLWYYIVIRKADNSTITIDDVKANLSMYYYWSLPKQIDELKSRTELLKNKNELLKNKNELLDGAISQFVTDYIIDTKDVRIGAVLGHGVTGVSIRKNNGLSIVVRGYMDANRGEKKYDSGWIETETSVNNLDASLWYYIVIRKADNSTITIDDVKANLLMYYYWLLPTQIEELKNRMADVENRTSVLNNSVSQPVTDYIIDIKDLRIGAVLGYNVISADIHKNNGLSLGVQGYTDSSKTDKKYDSGWIETETSVNNLDASLWYYIVIRKADNSTITIDDVKANLSMYYYWSLPKQIDELKSRTSDAILLSTTIHTIAHRGDDIDAPQCVEAAYIAARKRGHEIAENDVFNTSDGKYVMWHDADLKRLGSLVDLEGRQMYTDSTNFYWFDTQSGIVYDNNNQPTNLTTADLTKCDGTNYSVTNFTFDTVRKIDFGAYFSPKFAKSQILTFEEWVMLCKKLGMQIYIDHKTPYTNDILTDLYNTVKKCGMLNKATWLISSHRQAAFFRTLDPNSRIAALVHPDETNIETWKDIRDGGRGFAFNGSGKTATKEVIQLGLENGYEVEVWYVDFSESKEKTLQKIRDLVSYGITGLTTDKYRVDEAFQYLLN